jgi:AAA15 family ATPase/GTPase
MAARDFTLYIKDFKAIHVDEEEEDEYTRKGYMKLELRDITVLLGYRGVGKSSTLEALRLLYLASRKYGETESLATTINGVICGLDEGDLGRFSTSGRGRTKWHPVPDLVNKYSKDNNFTIILVAEEETFGIRGYYNVDKGECDVKFLENPKNNEIKDISRKQKRDIVPIVHLLSLQRIAPPQGAAELGAGGGFGGVRLAELAYVERDGIGVDGEYMIPILAWRTVFLDPTQKFWHDIIETFRMNLQRVVSAEKGKVVNDVGYDLKRGELVAEEKIMYEEKKGGETIYIPFTYLSMGTRNLLSIILEISIAQKLKDKNNIVVAIEEPELALHPSLLQGITNLMAEVARDSGGRIKFLLSTHSLRLVASLADILRERTVNVKIYHLSRYSKYTLVSELTGKPTIYNDISFHMLKNEVDLVFRLLEHYTK